MNKPNRLPGNDIKNPLVKICVDYIDFVASQDYCEDNDYKHYIFETALESVYGKNIWEFLNSK